MANITDLKVGQRVKMRRPHDKAVEFIGEIVGVSPNEPIVLVLTDPGNGSVESFETAHASDVTVIKEAPSGNDKGAAPASSAQGGADTSS